MRNSTSTPVMLCRVTWGAAMLTPPAHSARSFDNPRQLFGLIFLLQRLDQAFQVAVDHVRELVQRQVDAMVGHAALRKVIGADAFGTIARTDLQFARAGLRLVALFLLGRLELRLQQRHGARTVLVL